MCVVCVCAYMGDLMYMWGWEGSQAPCSQAQPPPLPVRSLLPLPLCLLSLMPKATLSSLCQSIMQVHSTSKGISGGGVPEVEP